MTVMKLPLYSSKHVSMKKDFPNSGWQRYLHDVGQVEWLLWLVREHGVQRFTAGSTAQRLA